MSAPKMQVKCGVDSCHYWESDYCTASSIEVNPMDNQDARTSDDTCCTTFVSSDQA